MTGISTPATRSPGSTAVGRADRDQRAAPAASLWPQCDYAMIKAMRLARARDARFVATWRSAPEDRRRMRAGATWAPTACRRPVPGLPRGYGATDAERIRWIEGHHAMLRDLFGDARAFSNCRWADADARATGSAHSEDRPALVGAGKCRTAKGSAGRNDRAETARGWRDADLSAYRAGRGVAATGFKGFSTPSAAVEGRRACSMPARPGARNHTRLFMAVTDPDRPDALRFNRG